MISFYFYYVNDEHEDMVGIEYIVITDKKSDESISIG